MADFLIFPSRWTYYDFYARYRVLCHSKDVKKEYRLTCENIVHKHIQVEYTDPN
jgi:myosin heavy subunit